MGHTERQKILNEKCDGNTLVYVPDDLKDSGFVEEPELCVNCEEPLVTPEEKDRGTCELCYGAEKNFK